MEERLTYLDREYLSNYDYLQVDSEVVLQKPFDAVKEVTATYSIASDDPEENATSLSYNRVVGLSTDPELYQAFDILDYALVSAPGAPIRQALIEAGIGEDVYGSYEAGIRQPVFSIVAKNANPQDKEAFVRIIEEQLTKAVKEGINKESLLAAINSNEFRFREADFGRFPKGLLMGLQCLDSWLFDDLTPFIHIQCLDTYAGLRRLTKTDYFEQLVQKYLLDNTHGSLVMILPEKNKNTAEEEALRRKLADFKAGLSEDQIRAMIQATADLRAYQEEPSSEENLKKIPLLRREDIRKEAMPYENTEDILGQIKVVRHEIDSNGIDYISLLFDAEDVPVEELGYLGMLSGILGYVDTDAHSYLGLGNEINIYTGGISFGPHTYARYQEDDTLVMKYEVGIKVLSGNLGKALSLAKEIMLHSKLSDTRRLKEIVAQTKARLQSALSGSGNAVAACRGSAGFSRMAYYQDKLQGVDFYRSVCEMEKLLKEEPDKVTATLEGLCERIFASGRLMVSFTGKEELYKEAAPLLAEVIDCLPKGMPCGPAPEVTLVKKNEAFIDASQIQYVAVCGNFKKAGFEYQGTLRLLRLILSYDYLWMNVRVKGGAYGVSTSCIRNGDSYFVSYRDPKLKETVEVFRGVPEYIRNFAPDERDMTKYIIGTFGSIDTPMNAYARGLRSLSAYICRTPHELVQKERSQILAATQQDVRALADIIEAILADASICVVGNENAIREAGELFDKVEKLYN